jgi:hypothetical protein
MLPTQAEPELLSRLSAAGLSPASLDPWEAWKVFKTYLKTEVSGVYDAAAFQAGPFEDDDGGQSYLAHFVRQFSHWEGNTDAPVRRVVIELRFPLTSIHPVAQAEAWTHDFPTLEEFASVVEGLAPFQSAMDATPASTDVYGEEL